MSWCLAEDYGNGDQFRLMSPCGSGRTLSFTSWFASYSLYCCLFLCVYWTDGVWLLRLGHAKISLEKTLGIVGMGLFTGLLDIQPTVSKHQRTFLMPCISYFPVSGLYSQQVPVAWWSPSSILQSVAGPFTFLERSA